MGTALEGGESGELDLGLGGGGGGVGGTKHPQSWEGPKVHRIFYLEFFVFACFKII